MTKLAGLSMSVVSVFRPLIAHSCVTPEIIYRGNVKLLRSGRNNSPQNSLKLTGPAKGNINYEHYNSTCGFYGPCGRLFC